MSGAMVIPLTRGYEAIIDAEDWPLVRPFSWQVVTPGRYAYAVSSFRDGLGSDAPCRKFYLHHLIADEARAPIRRPLNKNALDCRKANFGVVA